MKKRPTIEVMGRTFEFVKKFPTVKEVEDFNAKYPNRALYLYACLWLEITDEQQEIESNGKEG